VNSQPQIIHTDVLIVGGGPTGLTLANLLGCAPVRFLLIDRKASTIAEPRAVSIDDESLRTMQALGLADEVMKDVVPGYGVHYITRHGGRCFGRVEPTASEYGFPRRNAFRQPLFEATLRRGLDRFESDQTRFGHTLEVFTQDERGVSASVSDSEGRRFEVRARYLIGCDGGRSPVREMLGIKMVGSTFKSRWLVIDTQNDDDPFSQMRVYCDPGRAIVDVPGPHNTRRFEILVHPDESADDMLDAARIHDLLRPFRGDRDTDIIRKTVYTFHARVAERWQTGRVFLAGDAAHLTPPYAGQGMNSGVRDAFNLGWKLAGVLKGSLPGSALNSYEVERREHAWALIRLALNLGVVMAPSSRFSAFAWQSFFRFAGYIAPLRNFFLQMKFKPKPRFSEGLLGPRDDLGRRSLRGRMFAQPVVTLAAGDECLLDELIGQRFALIQYGAANEGELAALDDPLWLALDAVRVRILPAAASLPSASADSPQLRTVRDRDDALAGPLSAHDGRILLMRPDRYIAGTFPAGEERRFAADYAARLGVSTGIGTNRQAMRDTASEASTSVIRASSHPSAFERS
jgi:3-(3-hydroxy-phenyl)propionate hydroxylase